MSTAFSERPGRHERHYRRRLDNPLFGARRLYADDAALFEMQRLDHEELLTFLAELRETVQRAVDLEPNAGSEIILDLKERLDRLYETSAGLAEDHSANQAAIAQLVEVIMRNVERAAAGDPQAIAELEQERAARGAHFALLRWPLVADLLHPQSTVGADDLAPTLLTAEVAELDAALTLFDPDQLSLLYADAQRVASSAPATDAVGARLQQIETHLQRLHTPPPLN